MTKLQQEVVLYSLTSMIDVLKSIRAKAIRDKDKGLITYSQHMINGFTEVLEIVKVIPLEEDIGPYVWCD